MNATINFHCHLYAKSDRGIKTVRNRIVKALTACFNTDIARIKENSFQTIITYESWEMLIYETLLQCRSIGNAWTLTGNIDFKFNAQSEKISLVGVSSIEMLIDNPIHTLLPG